MSDRLLFHICTAADWATAEATGVLRPDSLDLEGFVHCSTAAQVTRVAGALYSGRRDLVLLVIHPDLVGARVAYEDCYESGEEFPHVYGPIPRAAVLVAPAFVPDDEGRFHLPEDAAAMVGPPPPH